MPQNVENDNEKSWKRNIHTFLDQLDKFPWFENVGKPVTEEGIKQVFSWNEAWQCLQDDSWIYASFHREIDQSHPIWAEAYDRAYESVVRSGRNYEFEEGNPVSRSAGWDAGGAAYQIEAGIKDGFYLKLMEWYRKGHWPCGWDGEYPEGKLIIH